MSVWLYLRCADHDPYITSREEVGQHYYDLERIFGHLLLRDEIIQDCNENDIDRDSSWEYRSKQLYNIGWNDSCAEKCSMIDPVTEIQAKSKSYFTSNLVEFILDHPRCHIEVVSEYGEVMQEGDVS